VSGRLADKVALITGTAGGQGREAALLFASEGATIVGCDVKAAAAQETVELVAAAGGQMSSRAPLDLTSSAAVTDWIDASVADHGRIDILYNNASAPKFECVEAMTDDAWHFTLRNELDLVFWACRAAWPHFRRFGGGVILNTASVQGLNAQPTRWGGVAHGSTKHGVIGMTRQLACEGGPHNIRVNAISPGFILTPATEPMLAVEGHLDEWLGHQVIKRPGLPEDVARAALFLVSDEAGFITGQNLVIDGGYTIV
jgi:meso-butanediol dehydrogenase / (S,S)-butanediol dehydrogenase / diacetyl reductase